MKINIGGLRGRLVKYESQTTGNNKFLIVSGHHTAHERMISFAEFLADYGDVYMVDLPGFGGMDSFRKIGKSISYDNYAEFLYTILKTQKLTKDVTVFSVSVGTQFVTRLFQKYPESQKWVSQSIGFVGFGAAKDFAMGGIYKFIILIYATLASTRVGALLAKIILLNRYSLKAAMTLFSKFKSKMKTDDTALRKMFIQMEVYLWIVNDMRTQSLTTLMMFNTDLRKYSDDLITVPFHNIVTKEDQYFDTKEINKTFRDMYTMYKPHYLEMGAHMPSMIADKAAVAKLFNQQIIDEIIGVKEKK